MESDEQWDLLINVDPNPMESDDLPIKFHKTIEKILAGADSDDHSHNKNSYILKYHLNPLSLSL
jgi:hypothetical protein